LSPGGNRRGVAFGITRNVSERRSWQLSYQHLFIDDAAVNVTNQSGTLVGNFESELDVIGFSLTFKR
jgi:long-subunit fatty acid transport protein